jgi:Spy/CpxP family protein refolding chaperone
LPQKKILLRRIVNPQVLGSVRVTPQEFQQGESIMHMKVRKHLKTIFLLTLAVSLLGATAALAQRGMGGGCGMGGGMGKRGLMMNLTPEQAAQVFDLKEKFRNDTAELRKNMMVKGAELRQMWKAEQPDEKAIQAKVKELTALRGQFMEKAIAQRLAMKKIVPAMGSHPMMGPGFMREPGQGKGPGPGAGLMPGSEEVADFDDHPDLEMAANPEAGW